ncbi:Fimbrial adhesin [Candidatus Burkholderia verschuerenii]|uniref:Fimbrial adhesin n=1 Tax=Candidatus Burkholderia verschuerenii TaxID=242163 RepID=A0A0L0MAL7_9BURK|nr:fimbrial protein [Candidatus Burkholderia verschuerenii]KND59331.1 Fimbrial adhesin [Candidatus Burkholderia verschuerenii]
MYKSSGVRVFQFFVGLLIALFSTASHAGGCTYSYFGGPQTISLTLPANFVVPRDLRVGSTILTIKGPQWNTSMILGNCSTAGTIYVDLVTQPHANLGSNIYATNVPGVGVKALSNGGSAAPVSGSYGVVTQGNVYAANNPASQLVFVKTGAITPGVITSADVPTIRNSLDRNFTIFTTSISGNMTVTSGTCTTPDVSVPMGTYLTTELKGLNTTTTAVNFNVALKACPAGMNSIAYRIDPVTTVINSANSVVALNAASTATGVGVQLLDSSGAVFPLSTQKTFSGYNSATGGDYALAFKARYYQTAATLTPGTANTSMTVSMVYQ